MDIMHSISSTSSKLERLAQLTPGGTALNSRLREALEEFAREEELDFQQDNIGNTYITRAGTDASLSSIALAFPLDAPSPAFAGALHAFRALRPKATSCAITLLGWSSPGAAPVGHDVWEGTLDVAAGVARAPELGAFAGNKAVAAFQLSAIFEVVDGAGKDEALVVRGSPVLTQATHRASKTAARVETGGPSSKRVPVVLVEGGEAVEVAAETVVQYSEYVAALFENFD